MSTWFTSDTHYGHANIIKYSKRPYRDVVEMDRDLIARHNAVVQPNHIVWHLGDFAFANKERQLAILKQLNGTICFLQGNHDKKDFLEAIVDASLALKVHLYPQLHELKMERQTIVLCHYGMRVWNKSFHGSWNLFGHSHGTLDAVGLQADVGVDSPHVTGKAEYRPLSFSEIAQYMSKRTSGAIHDDM